MPSSRTTGGVCLRTPDEFKKGGIRIESLAVGCLSGGALNMGILPLIGDAMLAVLALIA